MHDHNHPKHEYRTKRPTPPLDLSLLIIGGVLTVFMAFMAVIGMSPETGMGAYAKAAIVGIMAGGVSFAVNYFAINRGANLAATGYILAALFSVSTILIVGAGLSASTYSGMTITAVNELRLHDYAEKQAGHVGLQVKQASQGTRTLPVIRSVSADLRNKVECEIASACLSGRGGGRGSVTKALENLAARSDQIANQLEQGDQQRLSIIATLNKLLGSFQATLNDTSRSLSERRQALVVMDAKIDQTLSDLSEAVPTTLLSAYAGELASGVSIANRPQASAVASSLLANHARALESVLGTLNSESVAKPRFPAQAGVSSTFAYIAHFLPIAAIVAVVELVLPLTLWVYTYLAIVWDKERATRNATTQNPQNAPNRSSGSKRKASPQKNHRQSDANVTRIGLAKEERPRRSARGRAVSNSMRGDV
jgi:hypothetical protein